MQQLIRSTVLVFAGLLFCATQAQAALIGPDCGTCQGSIYTLDIAKVGGTFDNYLVTLTINTAGYDGGGVRIDEVAVKISAGADQASLVSGPGDVSAWQLKGGGISNSGCNGSGGGYECADLTVVSVGGIPLLTKPTLTWVFNINIDSTKGSVFDFNATNPDLLPSIKVRYVDSNDTKVGDLVSEKVPEPATLALLGVGAAVAAIRRRRTQR